MIGRRSRYARTPLAEVVDATGERVTLIEPRALVRVGAVFAHAAVEGDRLDLLAFRYYRDPLKHWRITDQADELDPWDVIVAGRALPIPPDR